ncbi:hypothetical protein [uncultured Mitsuokella sp.]|uniref:hypothetical protein n=1 Tax=uncultured Mitsuokella sp. TaxID=453120 RepID=UPI0026DD3728|nr:hypothetical protein [uncultured Mitsuokella sp.]
MKTFWTIVRDGYNVNPSEIIKARWATDEEKKNLTKVFKDLMVYGIEHHEIKNLTYEDTEEMWKGGRHVCFPGGYNDAVVISDSDVATLLRLDAERGRMAKIENLKKQIETYKKEIAFLSSKKLYTRAEAQEAAEKYNEKYNEGGEGYVPHYSTYTELEYYKNELAEAEKELEELK